MKALLTQKVLLGLLAAALIVGGVFTYLNIKGKKGAEIAFDPSTYSPTESTSGGRFALADLLLKTAPQKCTFVTTSGVADSSGVVYVANGVVRGDFESTVKMGETERRMLSHMITDKTHSYVWSDEMPGMGMKVPVTASRPPEAQEGTPGFDVHAPADFSCEPWTPDPAFFVPPSSVTWNDMGEMMKGRAVPQVGAPGTQTGVAPLPTGDIKEAQCKACDEAGEYRDSCRKALSCLP